MLRVLKEKSVNLNSPMQLIIKPKVRQRDLLPAKLPSFPRLQGAVPSAGERAANAQNKEMELCKLSEDFGRF